MFDNKPYTFDRVVRFGITVGLVWSLVWLLGYLSDVLIPFTVAFLLAYLTNPLVTFIDRQLLKAVRYGQRSIDAILDYPDISQNITQSENLDETVSPRELAPQEEVAPRRELPSSEKVLREKTGYHITAVFISLALVVLVVVLVASVFIPMVMEEFGHMGRVLTRLVNNTDVARMAAKRLPPDLWQVVKGYAARREVQEFFKTDSFWKMSSAVARKVLPGAWGIITGTMGVLTWLVGLASIGLYLVFLLLDYQKVKEGWQELIPPVYRQTVIDFVHDFDLAMNRYFRAQAAVAALVGIMMAIGFGLIGLPMGIILGLFVGLLNMVPYLQLIGLIPAFLLSLVHAVETGGSFLVICSLTALVFVVAQLVQDAVLVPKIMGKATGLSPAMILLSLSIWGKLLGMLGLLIALPMTCLLLAYYKRMVAAPASGPSDAQAG